MLKGWVGFTIDILPVKIHAEAKDLFSLGAKDLAPHYFDPPSSLHSIVYCNRSTVPQYTKIVPIQIIAMSYSSQGRGRGRGGGRGDYYKNKYGGGGRGRGRQQSREDFEEGGSHNNSAAGHISGGTFQELQALLKSIDGRQYPSYHDLETSPGGGWVNTDGLTRFTLEIGRAQSDPFAPPTQCRVSVPQSTALFPKNLVSNPIRRMASSDFLWRLVYRECQEMGANQTLKAGAVTWSGPKGGDVQIMEPTQHVLEQTAVWIKADGSVVGQLTVSLPARGRTILGAAAHQILNTVVTQLVSCCFVAVSVDLLAMQRHVDSVEDQVWLRDQLDGAGLVSFVRNGAILPRASGVDDRPMKVEESVLFLSPPSLEKQFSLPNAGCVATGMGIPRGITLICGGGFHGKSTLLDALQVAVYCKIPGDGREFCVTSPQAAKIRSEDGRCITAVDISSFIKNLPFGKSTTCFSTNDASGSTSQASNIVEVSLRNFVCVGMSFAIRVSQFVCPAISETVSSILEPVLIIDDHLNGMSAVARSDISLNVFIVSSRRLNWGPIHC